MMLLFMCLSDPNSDTQVKMCTLKMKVRQSDIAMYVCIAIPTTCSFPQNLANENISKSICIQKCLQTILMECF